VPSQIRITLVDWGTVTVAPPTATVLNVKLNEPVVLLVTEYSWTVEGRTMIWFDVKLPLNSWIKLDACALVSVSVPPVTTSANCVNANWVACP